MFKQNGQGMLEVCDLSFCMCRYTDFISRGYRVLNGLNWNQTRASFNCWVTTVVVIRCPLWSSTNRSWSLYGCWFSPPSKRFFSVTCLCGIVWGPAVLFSCTSSWKFSPPWSVGCSRHFNFIGVLNVLSDGCWTKGVCKTPVETHQSSLDIHHMNGAMLANYNLMKQWKVDKFGGLQQKIYFNVVERVQGL